MFYASVPVHLSVYLILNPSNIMNEDLLKSGF